MSRDARRFWRHVALWASVLTGVPVLYLAFTGFAYTGPAWPNWILAILSGLTSILPFAAFAAAAATRTRAASLVPALIAVGAFVTVSTGWIEPTLRYRANPNPLVEARLAEMGVEGPDTPGNLVARRRWILEHPPEEYIPSAEDPRAVPPNWVAFVAAFPFAIGLLTILSGVLGAMLGRGLPDNGRLRRIHRLWLAGIALFVATILTFHVVGVVVRSNLAFPGTLGALSLALAPAAAVALARRLDPDALTDEMENGGPDA